MSDRHVYLNIETKPPPSSDPAHFYHLVKVDARIKDPDKRDMQTAIKAKKLYDAQSTNPFRAHVFVLTLLEGDQEKPDVLIEVDERALVKALEQYIISLREEMGRDDVIVWHTYCGLTFDHLLLRLRGMKYRCPNVVREMTSYRFGDATHWDWFRRLGENGKLDEIAMFFGIPNDNPIDGSEIGDRYKRQDLETIRTHTASRVTILRDLHHLLGELEIRPAPPVVTDPELAA